MAAKPADRPALLAPEDLAQTLSCVQTILSLYAGAREDDEADGGEDGKEEADEGDLELDRANEAAIRTLAQFLALPLSSLGDAHSTALRDSMPAQIALGLRLRPWRGTLDAQRAGRQTLVLDIRLPLRRTDSHDGTDGVRWPDWRLRQATWLMDEQHAALVHSAEEAAKTFQDRHSNGQTDDDHDHDGQGASYILFVAETISESVLDLNIAS